MIKNIVFDFGQVLVHFDPDYMTRQYIKKEDDVSLAKDVIFDRLYWDRLDAGTITDEEVLAGIRSRLPQHLQEAAAMAYSHWMYHLPEVGGMRELLRELKREGYNLYLLSNISRGFAEHCDEIPILEEIENRVFSALCGAVKPEEKIFRHLCDTYGLLPEETLFVDDSEKNAKGAEAFGIRTFLFQNNPQKLREWIEEREREALQNENRKEG